ncbi:RluA family pseudouridine synthase [Geosporobacter ferrireducens]|nr:RluA family pseudouridine synthase [Geosporobacter ferrireducens]
MMIGKNEENQRIDKFLKKYLPKASLGFLYKMLRKKNIKVNNGRVEPQYLLRAGDLIQLYLSDDTLTGFQEQKQIKEVDIDFHIVYEDKNILLVNKPAGLLVHEDIKESKNTLVNQVIKYLYLKKEYNPDLEKTFVPASINRIDRNTSGIVVFGKNYEAVQNLNEMMRHKNHIHKYYQTIIKGTVEESSELSGFLWKDEKANQVQIVNRNRAGAKEIRTKLKPLKSNRDFSLVEVEIITGRSHQIRLHLSSIGHPIVGDGKYGDIKTNREFREKFGLSSQLLHAYKIVFEKTIGGMQYLEGKEFLCPLPEIFRKIEMNLF